MGSCLVATKGGSRYYVSFIDDYSRYYWVNLIKYRYDFLSTFVAIRAMIQTQYSAVIKCFQYDLGREYRDADVLNMLTSNGTIK